MNPKIRGVLFMPEMARAIGNTKPGVWPATAIDPALPFKWQTRRALTELQSCHGCFTGDCPHEKQIDCDIAISRYGAEICPYPVGTIIYVKESFWRFGRWAKDGGRRTKKTGRQRMRFKAASNEFKFEQPDGIPNVSREKDLWHKRPSMFMPMRAARYWLKVDNVRIERVNEITEADALAEGVKESFKRERRGGMMIETPIFAVDNYKTLYDSINGEQSFESDWCFVYEFQRIKPSKLFPK